MPAVNRTQEVAIWKLYNDDLGSGAFRNDARKIDSLAGNGNGELSLAEIDAFEARRQADPQFAAQAGDAAASLLRPEVERKLNTGAVAGALGYLKQVPQAVGSAIFWVLSLPLLLAGNKQ